MDSSVIEALKEAKFVRNADEFCTYLSKPKDLYDPGDALLTSVFSGERKKFPGERFTTDGWLHILRKAGLRTATESDVILECAKRVEFLGTECMKSRDLDDFEDLSNTQTIFSNFAVLYGNNFCDLLGKIKCIPAEFGFPNVVGKKGGKRVLTSYNEAILLKDWPLAWSYVPIISRQSAVPPEYSWGSLQLRSPPAFPAVLKHLQIIGRNGGEDTLAHWPTASGMMTIDEASCEVLKYLDKIWNSLSSSDIMELQRVPFIPAANGTRLVTANLLFARLTINLSPFAFELPTLYLPFLKILKDLGLQDIFSIASARDLLLNLQRTCGYQRLNPNELRAVLEILYFICDGTIGEDMSNWPNWTSEAIVPDDSCRLIYSPRSSRELCIVLGIKKLSDVVIEELDHQGHLQTLDYIGLVPLVAIREKLLSKSLQGAVWTVVNSMSSYIPAIKNLSLGTIQNLLEAVAEKLQFVKCLHTRFLLLPKSVDITQAAKDSIIPEWVDGSMHRTLYFINRSNTSILVAEPPPYISVFDVIAIVVSLVLGSPTPLPIGSLFVCPGGSETAIVDILKLCSDKQEMEATSGSNGLIGKELLPQDVHQVQFHPLRPFYAGEIVAWRSQNGEKLKYGRVPDDVRPSAGQALYRFKVETSTGVMQPLLSSHVFSFRSIAMGSETSPMPMDDSHTVVHNRTPVEMPETSGSGKARSSQLQAGKELQYGRVSAGELVQAVQEMLSAAGIYMDVEKQSLLQKTLMLQEQLKESQTSLLLEQEKADVAAKEADTAKAAWLCRVCLTAEVDITIVPCGHVLCRRCSSAVSRCPFCRLQVSKTMRIFRP
ncbi:sacsin [Prunus yedoensis var. nudiflora]|uniref:Sacsin n=1 Tax=Prunus yedoensis var. nudiflora TaxID=2094558 RepID=A0A314XZB4_PRUYE|nr:sacsin [Prunus yedoensis var. nudiflora]